MSVRYYPAIIERGDAGFGVFFPDLPGCTSGGDSLQAAALGAEEALRGHLEIMAERGEPMPAPSRFDAIQADPDVDEAARILVRAGIAGRTAAGAACAVTPLAEGYVVRGGQMPHPSRIRERPAAPGAMPRRGQPRSAREDPDDSTHE